MGKKRIHQLAKELDVASADILFKAKELGIQVKTASSGLTEDEEELIKLSYKEDSIVKETDSEEKDLKEIEDVSNKKNEDTKDINILEVTEGSTPEQLSLIIEKDSTEIVSDLMSLGIMQSVTSNLSNDEVVSYDNIPFTVYLTNDIQEFGVVGADKDGNLLYKFELDVEEAL